MALAYGPGEIDSADYRSRQEALLRLTAVGIEAIRLASVGTQANTAAAANPVLVPKITSVTRSVLSASAIAISATPQAVGASTTRLKVRITNNTGAIPSGGGIPNPYGIAPVEPCYVVVGYTGNALTADSWDQIIGPGRSIELDAPALAFSIAVKSDTPASIAGSVIVASYLS